MDNIRMIEKNGRWNIYIGAEWYSEHSNFEDACDVYNRLMCVLDEDDVDDPEDIY